MESHEVIKHLLQKIPAKQIASELGVSLSLVYKWAEPASLGSGASNPLDRTEALIRFAGSFELLEWLCARSDGTFVQKEKNNGEKINGQIAVGLLTRQFGMLLVEIGALVEAKDNASPQISALRQNWEKTKSSLNQLIEAAEAGQFSRQPFDLPENAVSKKPAANKSNAKNRSEYIALTAA